MEVTLTFADGSKITAALNGNCYITNEKPEIPEDLSLIMVSGAEERTFKNAQLVEPFSNDGRYWFSFIEVSDEEISREKTDAQVMYTALMTDTLIKED